MNVPDKHLKRDLIIAYFIFLGLTTILYIVYILHMIVLTKMYIHPIIKNKNHIHQ